MRYVTAFGRFWWDFVVGDDWRVAAGVAVALGLTRLLTALGANPWWLLPLAVALLLLASVYRAADRLGLLGQRRDHPGERSRLGVQLRRRFVVLLESHPSPPVFQLPRLSAAFDPDRRRRSSRLPRAGTRP